jgi:hypothetical protein
VHSFAFDANGDGQQNVWRLVHARMLEMHLCERTASGELDSNVGKFDWDESAASTCMNAACCAKMTDLIKKSAIVYVAAELCQFVFQDLLELKATRLRGWVTRAAAACL